MSDTSSDKRMSPSKETSLILPTTLLPPSGKLFAIGEPYNLNPA